MRSGKAIPEEQGKPSSFIQSSCFSFGESPASVEHTTSPSTKCFLPSVRNVGPRSASNQTQKPGTRSTFNHPQKARGHRPYLEPSTKAASPSRTSHKNPGAPSFAALCEGWDGSRLSQVAT